MSAAGDIGWTTGPYRIAPDEAGNPPLYGYFVTIWKRQQTGRWKVVMDLGTENPPDKPCSEEADLERYVRPASPMPSPAPTDEALMDLEKRLASRAGSEGHTVAYSAIVTDATRLYRDGHCPARVPGEVERMLGSLPGKLTWEPLSATVAATGDLAYSHGSYVLSAVEGQATVESGYYVRIWGTGADGFELLLEVTSPLPPEEG